MEKVAYILGAGFSQPLGLPLMRNFIMMAKDLYFKDPQRLDYFPKIFDALNNLARCKNYFRSNQTNIEEVLSILEMSDHLGDQQLRNLFIRFIVDTITSYTPDLSKLLFSKTAGFDRQPLMGNVHPWATTFGKFAYGMASVYLDRYSENDYARTNKHFNVQKEAERTHKYAVISLNYDLVFEHLATLLAKHCDQPIEDYIKCSFPETDESWDHLRIAKLHGSVDTGTIIPPTWSKTVPSEIKTNWKVALHILQDATQIRFMGYSLPSSDSYIKYLFKCAALHSNHLKNIDVVCYDPRGDAEQRYREFIEYDYFRFLNIKTENYLNEVAVMRSTRNMNTARFLLDEPKHDQLMENGIPDR